MNKQQINKVVLYGTSYELKVPKTKCKTLRDKALALVGLSLWNTLPLAIRSNRAVQGFNQALQPFLFSLAFALDL